MTAPVFPVLAGQGWSVHKKPTFASIVASHPSGREVRSPQYVNPVWQFELTFDGLDGTSSSQYGSLGASSLQALMGLFLQCQGQLNPFLFYDPTDYQAVTQPFGLGDGATQSFQLTRTLGGFAEAVTQPFAPAAPALFQVQGSAQQYAPCNLFNYSGAMTNAAWFLTSLSATGGVADPFGGTSAFTLTATAANGYTTQYKPEIVGLPGVVISAWMRRRTGSGAVSFYDPSSGAWRPVTVTSAWTRQNIATSSVTGNGAGFLLSTSGDAIDVYGPQIEAKTVATAGAYFATVQSDYFGGPWITAAGALLDPSAYAVSNGLVTFATPPANGAQLTWTGYFGFLCRFDADDLDFEQLMANLWQAQSVKFRSLRAK